MNHPLSDELRVRHVLDSIGEVESYLLNVSLDEFLANSEKFFAILCAAKRTKPGHCVAAIYKSPGCKAKTFLDVRRGLCNYVNDITLS
jgi:hypothetical protein